MWFNFNLAATLAPGHVTVAPASAAPKLDSMPINKLIDDKRSVVSDGFCIHCTVLATYAFARRIKFKLSPMT